MGGLRDYLLLSALLAASASLVDGKKKVVCYMVGWAITRPNEGRFAVTDADTDHCTHVIYAFMQIKDHRIASVDEDIDSQQLGKLKGLRKVNPGVKVMVSIGGYNEKGRKFSDVARDPELRAVFIGSLLDFLGKYDLNGIDICWQFPGQRGGRPEDKENAVILFREMKEAFKEHDYLLTVHILGKRYIVDEYDIPAISEIVDFINFPAVEYSGPWDRTTGVMAPLTSKDEQNVQFAVDYILKQGAPPEKVLLGVPLYGHAYILEKEPKEDNLIGLFSNKTYPGPWTNEFGITAFVETCHKFRYVPGWKQVWNEKSQTPLAFKDIYFISYDNERSLLLKADLVFTRSLGGIAFWSIDMDDFRGLCYDKPFPLVSAVSNYINSDEKPKPVVPLSFQPTLSPGEESKGPPEEVTSTEREGEKKNEVTEEEPKREISTTPRLEEVPIPTNTVLSEAEEAQNTEENKIEPTEINKDKLEPDLLNGRPADPQSNVEGHHHQPMEMPEKPIDATKKPTGSQYETSKPIETPQGAARPQDMGGLYPPVQSGYLQGPNRPIEYLQNSGSPVEKPIGSNSYPIGAPQRPYRPASSPQYPYRPNENFQGPQMTESQGKPETYPKEQYRPQSGYLNGPYRPPVAPTEPERPKPFESYNPQNAQGSYKPVVNTQNPGRPEGRPQGPYRPASNPEDKPYVFYKPNEGYIPVTNPVYQPNEGGYRPVANPEEKPYQVYQPNKGGYRPVVHPEEKPYEVYQPNEGGYRPVANPEEKPYQVYQPNEGGYRPVANPEEKPYHVYQPNEGGYRPVANPEEKPYQVYQPNEGGYRPVAEDKPYKPNEGGYRPLVYPEDLPASHPERPAGNPLTTLMYSPARPMTGPHQLYEPSHNPFQQFIPPGENPANYFIFIVKKCP